MSMGEGKAFPPLLPNEDDYIVTFDGPDDPRVALYEAEFEDGTGKSLEPDAYQMYVISYASWLEKRGTSREEDWLESHI